MNYRAAIAANDAAYFEKSAARVNARRVAEAPLLAHAGLVQLVTPEQRRSVLQAQAASVDAREARRQADEACDLTRASYALWDCAELGCDLRNLVDRIRHWPPGHWQKLAEMWRARLLAGQPAIAEHEIAVAHPCYAWMMRMFREPSQLEAELLAAKKWRDLGRARQERWEEHKASCPGCAMTVDQPASAVGK
jgi:hypothetical protein